MSKLIHSGLTIKVDYDGNSLANCCSRYLDLDISKGSQTSFTGELLTREQIEYAGLDVMLLSPIYPFLKEKIDLWDLNNALHLENSLIRPYGDSMCENLYLKVEEWQQNIDHQNVLVEESIARFHSLMFEYFEKECKELKLIQAEDEYVINWRSSTDKKVIMSILYPNMMDCSKISDYKAYRDNNPEEETKFIDWLLSREFDKLEEYLCVNHTKDLQEHNMFIPKNKVLINLNSNIHKLALFSVVKVSLGSTTHLNSVNKKDLARIKHPLATELKVYMKNSKLAASYGKNFLDAVDPDGMFRVKSYSQILNTGRSSMKLFQLLPGTSSYRNPFKPNNPKTGTRDDGFVWKVVGADYASQEAVVAATFAKEESLIKAIEEGCDFHSTCTSLMFPDEWKKLGGNPNPKGKPKDETLLKLRSQSKATSFGLMYGKSAVGLGESLDLPAHTEDLMTKYSKECKEFFKDTSESYEKFYKSFKSGRNTQGAKKEWIKGHKESGKFLPHITTADELVNRFYNTFPSIHSFLTECSDKAVKELFIYTPDPINRVRRFSHPKFESDTAEIRRQAMNFPIQGSSANMTKLAICFIKKYLEDNDLEHKMKFCLPLHDEVRYIAREDFAEEALKIIIDNMEKSASFILNNNLLKAEGEITEVWEK
jgi:hypothetical protein